MVWWNPATWGKQPEQPREVKLLSESKGFDLGGPATGQGLLAGLYTSSQPPRRGTRELLASTRHLPWLKSVVDKITHGVASTSWHVYRVPDSELRRQIRTCADRDEREKIYTRLREEGKLTKVPYNKAMNVPTDAVEISEHPFLLVWDRFNPTMTGRNGVITIQNHLELKGETFIMLVREPSTGDVAELWPLPPHWVVNLPNPAQQVPSFEVQAPNWRKMIPQEDMLWLKHPDPENPYGRGVGMAESLADELDSAEYATKHVKSWFYNRGIPELLIGVEGAKQDRLREAKSDFDGKFRGRGRGYGTYFHSGKLDVHQLNQSFADQQLVEFIEQKRDAVIHTYGVPPEMLGILEDSNRATVSAADFLFSRWVLTPRLEFLRVELTSCLLPEFDNGLVLDYDNPVPEDKHHQLEVVKEAPYAFTVDEIRNVAELPPLDGDEGQIYPVPTDVLFVESHDEIEAEVVEEPDDGFSDQ